MMDTLPAREIKHSVCRYFSSKGFAVIDEYTLPNRRRLDVCCIGPDGHIVGVETKISEADLRQDMKWTDYRHWCDTFYFAIWPGLPMNFHRVPVGLIVANKATCKIHRTSPISMMAASRRLQLITYFADVATKRLMNTADWATYHDTNGSERLRQAEYIVQASIAARREHGLE